MTDRGSSLRFYKPHQLRMRDYALREFLQTEGWKATPAWESRYAPGGDLYVPVLSQFWLSLTLYQ
jgi:hypothetical protein